PNSWESVACDAGQVYYNGTTYMMFYTGFDGASYNVGLATSTDGFHWTKHSSNPVLRRGQPGSWDQTSVHGNALIVRNGVFYLFYTGSPGNSLGFATSADGINWIKFSGNPVFLPGSGGSWASQISLGSMILQNNQIEYWYTGYGGSRWQIGRAFSQLISQSDLNAPARTDLKGYGLTQIYPNPANPYAVIQYSLPSDGHVTLRIYDALGRVVETLVEEQKRSGTYTHTWSPRNLASGVYWCRMTSGSYFASQKMVYLK
ncbi:MAG: T9SS type A sorting domain-containing protein, partial [Bacteroidota bacterium]